MKLSVRLQLVIIISVACAVSLLVNYHRLPPYTVVCDGHGNWGYVLGGFEVFPAHSKEDAVRSLESVKLIQAEREARKNSYWRVCK